MESKENLIDSLKSKIDENLKDLLDSAISDEGWKNISKLNGEIQVHKKKKDNSPIHSVRGKTNLNVKAEEVFATVKALDCVKDWDPISGKVLETVDDTHDIIYAHYTLDTPLLHDREFVYLESRFTGLEDGRIVVLCFSIERDDVKVADSNVRGIMHSSGFVIRPIDAGNCEVAYIIQVDPKGWLPNWLVNLVSGAEPACLTRIRDFILKNRAN